MYVGPVLLFLSLFSKATFADHIRMGVNVGTSSQVIGVVNICSSLACIFSCNALLRASTAILAEYEIAGKFKMIQFGIITLKYPIAILALSHANTSIDDVYTTSVMNMAWSCITCLVLYAFLSFGFRKHFDVTTARDAMRNAQNASYTASLQSKTEIIDLIDQRSNGLAPGYVRFEDENSQSLGRGNIENITTELIANERINVGDDYLRYDTPKGNDNAAEYVAPAANGVGNDSQQRLL